MTKIAVTGARGLLGWHTAGRLHAQNCAAKYKGQPEPFDLVLIDHESFADSQILAAFVEGADAIIHFAGVNRGADDEVERANPDIAKALVAACKASGAQPHIIYANSIQAAIDNSYGRSKRLASEILELFAEGRYTNLILPHIFGECARPYYNNVTATLIDNIWKGEEPVLNANGRVKLLHAGEAAEMAIGAVISGDFGTQTPPGQDISVVELYMRLKAFHELYEADIFPDLTDSFDLALFNCYRTGGYPDHYPKVLKCNSDHRGILFESAKGGHESHTFLSTTLPGQKRGDHFHYDLVERFLVVRGEAIIRVRKILTNEVQEFHVSGDAPAAIDMPPLHTHHIENISSSDVLTFFWSNRIFDPNNPDTYADPV